MRKDSHKLADRDVYKGVIETIKVLQCKLGLEPDGIFGSGTVSKLKAFQTEKGLKPDAIVGPATWGKMFEESQESETEETPSTNECYKEFGVDITDGNNMAGYEVEEQRQIEKDGKVFIFGFKSDGTGNLNKSRAGGGNSNPFKWSCENGELKMWQELEF